MGDKKSKVAQEEIIEHLNKTWCDLSKASKVASGLWDKGLNIDGPSARFQKTCQDLADVLEKTEAVLGDLGFVLKFKKMKSGAMTVTAAQTLQTSSAEIMIELLESSKALKALMPKKEE